MMRKPSTLIRLHFLNLAINSLEELAGSTRSFSQRQAAPVQPQVSLLCDKVINSYLKEIRNAIHISVAQELFSRPLTAFGASLAMIKHAALHVVDTHRSNDVSVHRIVRSLFSPAGSNRFFENGDSGGRSATPFTKQVDKNATIVIKAANRVHVASRSHRRH